MTSAPLDLAKRLRRVSTYYALDGAMPGRWNAIVSPELLIEAATALEDHARMLADADALLSAVDIGWWDAQQDRDAFERSTLRHASRTAKGKEEG